MLPAPPQHSQPTSSQVCLAVDDMSIEVRHEQNGVARDALLAILAQSLAAEQSEPPADILQQVAPQLAARRGPPPTPGVVPELPAAAGPAGYGVRPASARAQYARPSAPDNSLARTLLGSELKQREAAQHDANQDALARFRADQQAQLQAERLAHQDQAQAEREAGILARQMSQDMPQWVQQGLAARTHRYSPAQLREREDLFRSIDQVYADNRFTPGQKARFEARQRERIRQIDLSPQEVPPNEWPVSPQQQAQQNSWEETDPITGIKVRKFLSTRNGVPQPQIDPVSDAHIKDWLDQRQFERQMQLKEFEAANRPDQSFEHTNTLNRRKDSLNKQLPRLWAAIRAADAIVKNTASGEFINDKGETVTAEQAQAALQDALAAFDAVQRELHGIDQQIAQIQTRPTQSVVPDSQPQAAPLTQTPPSSGPLTAPLQSPWADMGMGDPTQLDAPEQQPISPRADMGMGDPTQPAAEPPSQQPPTPVASREELERLPVGTRFILPDGRTGTRQ